MYNCEKYIEDTLNSLLSQIYPNIEIIIIDDSSTDKSYDIVKTYESKYKNIKLFKQDKLGPQVARNSAFKLSKGDYIQYFDADDIMHPQKISSQMDIMKNYDYQYDVVTTGISRIFFNSIDNSKYKKSIIHKSYDNNLEFLKDSWENSKTIIGQSWLISRKLNKKIGGWREELLQNQDGEFFTRVAFNSKKIIFVENSIVYYRQREGSVKTQKSIEHVKSHLNSYKMYIETIKNDLDKNEMKKASALLFTTFYKMHYPLNQDLKNEMMQQLNLLGFKKPVFKFRFNLQSIIILVIGLERYLILKRKKK